MTPELIDFIATRTQISKKGIQNTISLLDSGSSIPFIARYRKEATGSLHEEEVFDIQKYQKLYQDIQSRKEYILKTLAEQQKLTKELENAIRECSDLHMLEDIYAPYKQKKKTKADVAREHGLEPLAHGVMSHGNYSIQIAAKQFKHPDYPDLESVLDGVRSIIADLIHQDLELREQLRRIVKKEGILKSVLVKSKKTEAQKFRDYFEYQELLHRIAPHRYLAVCRGEEEKFLRLSIQIQESDLLFRITKKYRYRHSAENAYQLELAIQDAWDRLIFPLIQSQIRQELKEQADIKSIEVFGKNLRQALMEAPLGEKKLIAIDPGFRTGSKLVVLDASGQLLEYTNIYPLEPQNAKTASLQTLTQLMEKNSVNTIAVGNGTGGKEMCQWLEQHFSNQNIEIHSVDESGASIYSASAIARQEFPDLDLIYRGAISIGRRLQDPLAELIKIDPKSMGLGQYQHDVHQKWLVDRLDYEVSKCVHAVGVQLNSASAVLLSYISGIGSNLAESIVQYRNQMGFFKTKSELLKIPRLGAKVFEQCAGFVRIRNGKHPLDNTAVHPERYPLVTKMAESIQMSLEALVGQEKNTSQIQLAQFISDDCQISSLQDIISEINKPGIDPRGKLMPFAFDHSIKSIEDVREGMILPAIIKNITQFGAFADIGIKESGLIHISEMSDQHIKDVGDRLTLRQKLLVKVLKVDLPLKRIQLSLRGIRS